MGLLARVMSTGGAETRKHECSACHEIFESEEDDGVLRCPVCGDRNVSVLD